MKKLKKRAIVPKPIASPDLAKVTGGAGGGYGSPVKPSGPGG